MPSWAAAELVKFPSGVFVHYLALADYGGPDNPNAGIDAFQQRIAAPLLGGVENALDFLRFACLQNTRSQIPTALPSIYGRLASLPPDAARRWCWLANQLASFVDLNQ